MDDICIFMSTCPCYEKNRCTKKVDPDTECIIRLIDAYKYIRELYGKALGDQMDQLARESVIRQQNCRMFETIMELMDRDDRYTLK